MKLKATLVFFLLSALTFAQQSFFDVIKFHGSDAEYISFGQVYVNDDGKQQTSNGKPSNYSVKLYDYMGLSSGLVVHYLYDDKNKKPLLRRGYNITKEPVISLVGFPNTSMVHHGAYNRAYVAIDNYIFF